MTTTIPTVPATPVADEDVFGMDAAQTLGCLLTEHAAERAAAAAKMRAATHWADLHRVLDGIPGALDPDIAQTLSCDATIERCAGELRLAGQGAFGVEEFAVCELAAALGMSEPAARAYVGQSLEVRDRLPKCWARVMSGDLPDWKARQIAEQTIPLGDEAAEYVDAQLAAFAHKLSLGRIEKCVEAAVMRFEPDLAAERAAAAAEQRGVWTEARSDGTGELRAVADLPDIEAFDATVDRTATTLGRLGDPDSHDVRRAKALGVLADPQYALDLLTDPETATATPGARPTVHLHLHTDSLAALATSTTTARVNEGVTVNPVTQRVTGVARVEDLGPVPLEAVRRWIAGLAPGASVKLTPVVDLAEHITVDAYEIPDRLRTQIEHRDPGCVFPWCGRQGRHDLDHIEPFDHGEPDDRAGPGTGRPPPGQTTTANLARLCRFHHRVKTHSRWSYRRAGPTTVEWTSPHGLTYTVDHTGTTAHLG